MAASERSASLLVLGLGNVLCGDDGLGVAAIELLRRRYQTPAGTRVLDGGTLGLALLSHIQASDDVIFVDAIQGSGPPGTLIRIEGDGVTAAVRTRLSCHQVGVADLLDALHMLDDYPQRLLLLGLIPETLELRLGRSAAIEAQLPALVEEVAAEARRLGYRLLPKGGDWAAADEPASPAARALGL